MGFFSTRNHDGASAVAESCNSIPNTEMERLRDRAHRHNQVTSDAEIRFGRAHDPKKAENN